jgi:lichenan operon transcriptional antiterminator
MILKLGGALKKLGFIDDEYIEGAIERERLSSTVFVDGLAMPHSMSMTANVPTIAIVVNDTPMLWGDQKVSIVAFVAFGASGRGEFQTVFEQFIDLFSDDKARAVVERESRDFESFIDSVVRVIDA